MIVPFVRAMVSTSAALTMTSAAASGWCAQCGRLHSLPQTADAQAHAQALISAIDHSGTFDLDSADPDERFAITAMHRPGKMLGVMTTCDGTILKAFSGKLGTPSTWHCPGWAEPLGEAHSAQTSKRFAEIVRHVQEAASAKDAATRAEHTRVHRELSLQLAADMQSALILANARGKSARLSEVIARGYALDSEGVTRAQLAKIPGGVGDCAAPKLLMAAYSVSNLQRTRCSHTQ